MFIRPIALLLDRGLESNAVTTVSSECNVHGMTASENHLCIRVAALNGRAACVLGHMQSSITIAAFFVLLRHNRR